MRPSNVKAVGKEHIGDADDEDVPPWRFFNLYSLSKFQSISDVENIFPFQMFILVFPLAIGFKGGDFH